VGERRATGERKYYLANLPADAPLERLAATIKARRVCEQAHQRLKEELGLDHFEGRSRTGLHRHALMTLIACAFLRHLRLERASGRGKKRHGNTGTAAARPTLPAVRRMLLERLFERLWRTLTRCPSCGARLGPPPPVKVPR